MVSNGMLAHAKQLTQHTMICQLVYEANFHEMAARACSGVAHGLELSSVLTMGERATAQRLAVIDRGADPLI
jgi:hypothetical protein